MTTTDTTQMRTDARTLGVPFNSALEAAEACAPCTWGALHGIAKVVGRDDIAARADQMATAPHTH